MFVSSPPAKKKSWLKRRTTCEKWLTIISLGAIIAIVILAASRSSTTNETDGVLESSNSQTQNYQTNTQTEDKVKGKIRYQWRIQRGFRGFV